MTSTNAISVLTILFTLLATFPFGTLGLGETNRDSPDHKDVSIAAKRKTAQDQTDVKAVQLLKSWQIGSSTGILGDYSQTAFNELRSNGIEYLELGSRSFRDKTQEKCEAWVEDLKRKTEQAGIEIWSVHLPFSSSLDISTTNEENRINMIKECSRIMALCKPLNPSKFVIHPSEPMSGDERPIRLEKSIASLKLLTEEVKKYGAQLAVENLPRICLGSTSEEILEIVNAVGNGLGVCFDSNHLLHEKPEEFVSQVGHLISTVHISDYDGIDERHWLPGTGIVNWTNELLKHGYSGPFMFETSRRNPASLSQDSRNERLNAKDLADCLRMLRKNYLGSLEL